MEDVLKVLLSVAIFFATGWGVTALMVRIFFPFKVTRAGSRKRYDVKTLKSIRPKGALSVRHA